MKKTNEIVNTKAISVQTYRWDRYGNFITNVADAVCEYIHNGYAAGCRALATRYDTVVRVDVEIDGNILRVKNAGVPADLNKVLNYGGESKDTPLNQFGTGFKTATSFFNPANDGWAFYTKDGNRFFRVRAPYSETMEIEEISKWPFEPWVTSCVEVKVESNEILMELTDKKFVKELGFRYSFALEEHLVLNCNKTRVTAINPNGEVKKSEKTTLPILGREVECTYSLYELNDTAENDEFYTASEHCQGVYVFVNNCFAEHAGVGIIHKKDGREYLKSHPSLNHHIAVFNIIVPDDDRELDVPFVNSKNKINWKRCTKGREYLNAINEICGNFFREKRLNAAEKKKREWIDKELMPKMCDGMSFYVTEYNVTNKEKRNEGLRADAVIAMHKGKDGKIAPASVKKVVEFKSGRVTSAHVGQVLGYFVQLAKHHKKKENRPSILIAGRELSPEAKDYIEFIKNELGITVGFVPMNCEYDF